MFKLIRSLVILFCVLLAASPAGAVIAARAEKKPTIPQLQRQADQAAARFSEARSAYEKLGDDITDLERRVTEIRARIAPLRDAVTRRAVAVYKGSRGLDTLSDLGRVADPVESARGARIVAQVSAADLDGIQELAASAAALRDEQEALTVRRQEQEAALAKLEDERRDVETQLAIMVRAGQELQSRLVRPSRSASGRASRSGRAAAVPVPVDPADLQGIPVATDFVCPIRGALAFTDSWGSPRSGGRRHQGTDLMSPHGSDNVAVVSGQIKRHHSGAGGLSIYLHGDNGHRYYYAHLSEVVGPDRRVAQGELIGRTGNSGNARGGSPHTHFEIHPGGGAAVNPYPTLRAHC